jgi:hypothetical protein
VLLEVLLTSRVHKAEGGGVRGPCWLAGLPCGLLGRVSGMGHGKRVVGLGLGWVKGLGPLSFSILFQHTQTKLNSNSNLNSTLARNQIKEMLQHDATTKIKPMIDFNYL